MTAGIFMPGYRVGKITPPPEYIEKIDHDGGKFTYRALGALTNDRFYYEPSLGLWFYYTTNKATLRSKVRQWNDATYAADPHTALSVTDGASVTQTITCNQIITSGVTDMNSLLYNASAFNQDIGAWDVSNVTDMNSILTGSSTFNQYIGWWDTSSVVDFGSAFRTASAFNQYIGSWNTSSAKYMNSMFWNATMFDQDLSGWCVSLIGAKPINFDTNSGFAGNSAKQPQWGTCP